MKRAVALMMMMMVFLIVARADEMGVDPFRDSGPRVDASFGLCIPECAISCILKLRWNPIAYGICFGLCLIGCKNTPSDAVYGCTSTCAYSHEFSPQPVTDRSSAEGYVNWCYDNCKKE